MPLPRLVCAIVLSLGMCNAARADDLKLRIIKLRIIALNDFHGNLRSPGKYRAGAESPLVDVGGVDFLAGYIRHLKEGSPNNVVVAAGDLIGASPLVSGLFHDEDTIETLNRAGLELSAVGNHEFDHGRQELLRMQSGGCSTRDKSTCEGAVTGTRVPFEGAKFKYLAANVMDFSTGKTLFPSYAVKSYHGVKVAFIGLTLKETPTMVTASGVAGLRFADEANTINTAARQLRGKGIKIIVVLIHQGGRQTTAGTPDINACEGDLEGTAIHSIVAKLDDTVSLVVSGHTHQAYICEVANSAGRKILVTSAAMYGRLLTQIDLTIDRKTKALTAVSARNLLVDRTNSAGITPDPELKKIVDQYAVLAAPIADRVVGTITAPFTKTFSPAGENSVGDLIADAQLEATSAPDSGGAVVAFMNEGGVRTEIPFASGAQGVPEGSVTYGELFSVQPFGNNLVTMTLTGAQIKILLEEQFKDCTLEYPPGEDKSTSADRVLSPSEGFSYTWNSRGSTCEKVDAGSMKINGSVVIPTANYRVTVNNFLADGGDQMYILKRGSDPVGGPLDIDAMEAYFARHPSVAPAELHRISVLP
ncbi:MAG TPA: bifunctional metallophosphatase/5'-nucleotidase [Candidatus Acidoferrales bacterium]|nr:bifunctional metallophosphatase/5'-nucleotidase [Candidatus Acidoferrales bacterium]